MPADDRNENKRVRREPNMVGEEAERDRAEKDRQPLK